MAQVVPDQPHPTFRSSVELVAMTAIVRDRDGRPVAGLSRADFELIDAGERRTIANFRAEPASASVAILLDVSGSMAVGSKLENARQAMAHLVSWLDPRTDEVAVYTFDSTLRAQQPFAPASIEAVLHLPRFDPFGSTSLYDATAQVAQRVAGQRRTRRAVVVVTDGVDTSSHLLASEVSRLSSDIEVPVYLIAVSTPLDHPLDAGRTSGDGSAPAAWSLARLVGQTGGVSFVVTRPADASAAARQIAAELHLGYQIAFEPGSQAGWHELSLHTRRKGLLVRARTGYFAGTTAVVARQMTAGK
ncbi:MAG: VWA domain-containing protein [Acidobacteriota bacterium]